MDYEKMYKEALEDMRAIYPNLKGDAKIAVGKIRATITADEIYHRRLAVSVLETRKEVRQKMEDQK